jgi:hypothetical protein
MVCVLCLDGGGVSADREMRRSLGGAMLPVLKDLLCDVLRLMILAS